MQFVLRSASPVPGAPARCLRRAPCVENEPVSLRLRPGARVPGAPAGSGPYGSADSGLKTKRLVRIIVDHLGKELSSSPYGHRQRAGAAGGVGGRARGRSPDHAHLAAARSPVRVPRRRPRTAPALRRTLRVVSPRPPPGPAAGRGPNGGGPRRSGSQKCVGIGNGSFLHRENNPLEASWGYAESSQRLGGRGGRTRGGRGSARGGGAPGLTFPSPGRGSSQRRPAGAVLEKAGRGAGPDQTL